jgi:hypothetical protein
MPPAKKTAPKKRTMSDEHKAALAAGRESGRAVRVYLEALESNKPKRGRKRTKESMTNRLASIEDEISTADPVKRLSLIQERIDLETLLSGTEDQVDLSELEKAFIKYAADYSDRKGISYAAWRELGLSPAVLKAAGISR